MNTRSLTRNLFPPLDNPKLTIRRRPRVDPTLLNDFNMATNKNGDEVPPTGGGDLPVPDLQTMEKLCQPTLNGDDANKHLDKFLHVTQSIKVNGVTDDTLRLYLFPHSLTHHATAWFDHFPRNSITTFEKMAKMFLGKYFPPSMVKKLRNEITNFHQRPDDSLFKAWERYKLLIDRCPNHNMLPVTQIDTFYNELTLRHRDTINATAGGTFMKRRPEECYDLIKSMIAHHNNWDTSVQKSESSSSITSSPDPKIIALKAKMAEINKNLMKVLQINQQVKEVTHSCETCSGPHSYNDCPATVGQTQNVYAAGAYNQGGNSYQPQGNHNLLSYRSDNYLGPLGFNQNQNQSNQNQNYQNRNQGNNHGNPLGNNQGRNQFFQGASHGQNPPPAYQASAYQAMGYQAPNMFGQFMKMNTASSLSSGMLPSNTITNPKEDLKGITTRSGNAYEGPTIPTTSSSFKVAEHETEPVIAPVVEPVEVPVSALKPNPKLSIPYLSRLHDQKLRDKANDQKEKFFQIFQDLNFIISFVDALILMPKFGPTIKSLLTNKEKLFELARTPLNEHCSAVLLKKLPEKLGDPGKFLIPCDFSRKDEWRSFIKTRRTLIDAYEGELTLRVGKEAITFNLDQTSRYSAIEDEPISPKIDDSFYDLDGDILLLEQFLNDDPSSPPLPPQELKGDDKLPVIIAKDLKDEEKPALIKVLKSQKQALTWKLFDLKGINLEFYTHKILMKDDFKPAVPHLRRVNPNIHEVIKKEMVVDSSFFVETIGIKLRGVDPVNSNTQRVTEILQDVQAPEEINCAYQGNEPDSGNDLLEELL
nr:hypothetical protein [Tanacetum cinerariifolium]